MSSTRESVSLLVPGKTFLLGEYAVLHNGPAVVLAHGPRFSLRIDEAETGTAEGIHPKSPAGQFMRLQPDKFARLAARFLDPYGGQGGFGASSAQFVSVFAWSKLQSSPWARLNFSVEDAWRAFKDLDHGAGQPPSGADVVAQILGDVTVFAADPFSAQAVKWPFQDLVVMLAPTGQKLATHEHLRERLPVSDRLMRLAEEGRDALLASDRSRFVAAFTGYAAELEELQLVTTHTRGLIAAAASNPDVIAVKGCGAMGADVMAVLVERPKVHEVEKYLNEHGLRVASTSDRIEAGVTLEARLAPRHDQGTAWA
jgi:mevalonate kinase